LERWTSVYLTGHTQDALIQAIEPRLRVALVTNGGTAFDITEEAVPG